MSNEYDSIIFRTEVFSLCEASCSMYDIIKSITSTNAPYFSKKGYGSRRPSITTKREITWQLEDTVKSRLERMLQKELPVVTLHRGGKTQETLKETGSLAMAHGNHIYIREEEYVEGSSVTDALLLHELTHVLQAEEGRQIKSKEDIAEAEEEALRNEKKAEYVEDPYYYVQIGDELFYVNKAIEKKAISVAVGELRTILERAKEEKDIQKLTMIKNRLERRI